MKRTIQLPSLDTLHERYDYSVITGEFYYKTNPRSKHKIGDPAGCINGEGYKTLRVNNKRYQVHRLVWMWVTGEDPGEMEVDHIDGDRTNNSWHNLRLATARQNKHNTTKYTTNKSGYKGVYLASPGRWRAAITLDYKTIHLGYFDSPEEASVCYNVAVEKYHGDYGKN